MLAGQSLAEISGGARGCTSSNQCYTISLADGQSYHFWDTAGLNEADDGTVSSQVAIQNLLDLVRDHGVNLVMFCVRDRLPNIIRVNYDLFWGIICRKKVPIVLVATGQEGRNEMDDWWRENQKTLRKMKLAFKGHACITSWKGRENINEKDYEASAAKVWKLVSEHCAPTTWHMPPQWPAQAQREIEAYENNYKAGNGMQRFLQLTRLFFLR
jgi:hypothetical protein